MPSGVRVTGPSGCHSAWSRWVPYVLAAPLVHGEAKAQRGGGRPPGAQLLPGLRGAGRTDRGGHPLLPEKGREKPFQNRQRRRRTPGQ